MSKQTGNRPSGYHKVLLLLILYGTLALLTASVSADTSSVTIAASGDRSYYLGEKVVFSGHNEDSNTTYLYLTGPGTFVKGPGIPAGGGNLTSPLQAVASGNPASFTAVKTNPDKTWEYAFYTANLPLDAGTYTVNAAGRPDAEEEPGTDGANVGIIIKKPFITAQVSPATIADTEPFTVSGVAEGIPSSVQIWILGKNSFSNATVPVNADDASFTYAVPQNTAGQPAGGRYFVIVQHPMADNRFDFMISGDYVRNLNKGTDVFRISGTGSLQGSDAADALIAAISDQESDDPASSAHDTYTMIPVQVTDRASGSSAGTGVTLSAEGDKSYYLGEKVVLGGLNEDSNTTYLYLTGPGTFVKGPGIPAGGGNLTSPLQAVASGNPASFTAVKTNPDKTWEYAFYTANLPVDAGTYTICAAGRPETMDMACPAAAEVGIILKKPFITAGISPVQVTEGEPFTVTGTAEGNPPDVQVWILGDNYVFNATVAVNPDASFTFTGDTQRTGNLPRGRLYLIVQHSMQNNTFDIVRSGDYVRTVQGNAILFRIAGAGSLQGSDAADALTAALNDPQNGDDTFTVIPFSVEGTGSSAPQAQPATTAPVQGQAKPDLIPFALIGAVVLVLGIVVWKRQ
jgi:hypothetical protein